MRRLGYQQRRLRDLAAAFGSRRALAERERWPRERLERYQRERLEALVRHARERSPFWARRLPPGTVSLERLPTMDRVEMMASFDELVTDRRLRRDELAAGLERSGRDELYLGEFRVMATSGSSGRPGLFVYDRRAWIGILSQFLRYSAWVGIRPRLPRLRIAAVGGAAPSHMTQRVAASVAVGLHRVTALPVTAPLPRLVGQLNAARPEVLNAYPSIATLLAEHQGPPVLRWAAFEAAQCACRERSPDHGYYLDTRERLDGKQATLTIARKLIRRAHHTLRELGDEALQPVSIT